MKEKIGEQWKKLGEKQVGWLHGWIIYNIHSYNNANMLFKYN
jgi:hypothetical protein